MNPKKNKTFISVVVWIMVVGLVGSFAPLIFQKPQIADESYYYDVPPQTASLTPPEPTSTTTLPEEKISPEGFEGLSEEGESVKDLENLLGD